MQANTEIHDLKSIRDSFYCIYKRKSHLNQIFGWSNLGTILSCFHIFLTDLNWLYTYFSVFSFEIEIGEYLYFENIDKI